MMPSCSIFFPCDENKNMSSHPDHDLYGHCISSSESAKHPTTMRTAVRAWQSSRDFSGSVAARRTQLDWRGNCCLQLRQKAIPETAWDGSKRCFNRCWKLSLGPANSFNLAK